MATLYGKRSSKKVKVKTYQMRTHLQVLQIDVPLLRDTNSQFYFDIVIHPKSLTSSGKMIISTLRKGQARSFLITVGKLQAFLNLFYKNRK